MSDLSITICYLRYLSIYLSIYGGVVEGGGGGPRAARGMGGAPTTPNQLWGGPACKSLRTPDLKEPCVCYYCFVVVAAAHCVCVCVMTTVCDYMVLVDEQLKVNLGSNRAV